MQIGDQTRVELHYQIVGVDRNLNEEKNADYSEWVGIKWTYHDLTKRQKAWKLFEKQSVSWLDSWCVHKWRSKKIYWIFDHEKRGEILNILIMKKGGNILKKIDHEKKGGIYWIFQSPLGGHSSKGSQQPGSQRFHLQCSPTTGFWRSFFSFCKMDYARGWLTRDFRWANSRSSLNISEKHSGNWRTPTGGKEWWDC